METVRAACRNFSVLVIVTLHLASFCHLYSSCSCLCHILLFLKSSLQSTQHIWTQLSTEALHRVLAHLSLHAYAHSCSLAVTLMYLNVVCEVEGGLRYRFGIECRMMQCPYVILKTFRAHDSSMKNLSLPPPPLLIPPCVLSALMVCENVQPVLPSPQAPVAVFTRFCSFVFTCRHTFAWLHECRQTRMCRISFTPDFDKVMSNSHLSGVLDSLATGGN